MAILDALKQKRTSIIIEADLWMRVKEAAKPGATYQYVEKALREKLKREEQPTETQQTHKTNKESL